MTTERRADLLNDEANSTRSRVAVAGESISYYFGGFGTGMIPG
jgi:hypothetical protein